MQENVNNPDILGSYDFLKKLAVEEIDKICNKEGYVDKFICFYIKFLRKFLFTVYIFLVCLFHGMNIELNRTDFNWALSTVIELVILFFVIFDILGFHYFILKLKGMFLNIIMLLYFLITAALITLKIWGPSKDYYKAIYATNILRIFIVLVIIFVFDEKNSIILNGRLDFDVKVFNKAMLETQKPLKDTSGNEFFKKEVVVVKHSKRQSLLRTPNRNSVELSDTKIMEEINICIRKKVNHKLKQEEVINPSKLYKVVSENIDLILNDDFNVFSLDENCLKHSLYLLMNYYYKIYKFEEIKIPENRYLNLICNIEKSYNENPYHSSIHASDVVNTIYYLLEKMSISEICEYSQLEILILLLSAAAHDIDHPGNNNLFEINNRTQIAFTYNDKSVLENYHLYVFFNLLKNNFMNIFENYDVTQNKNIRRLIISNIISTDMVLHKPEANKFSDMMNNPEFSPKKQETKEYIMTHMIHFSDISNPTKSFDVYNIWVKKIFTEFFNQGDKEKELGLPVSMMCDRNTTQIPNSQIFFMNFFVMEELNLIIKFAPKAVFLKETLEENKKRYEEIKHLPYII